jgi:GntR family transcriptional regulator/MocR family aminotransferase
LVSIDQGDSRPLHEQLEQALRSAIRAGRLPAGSPLPSSRSLCAELGVSRGTVSWAYGQLAAEGYLVTRQGAPVRVSDALRGQPVRPSARSLTAPFHYDARPGPDLAAFPRDRWQRSLRTAWRTAPAGRLGELDPRGIPELRDALALYLDRVRGTACDPELLLVCTGFHQGLSLACQWLRNSGIERIGVEDPGWHQHRLIAQQSGLEVMAIPVDEAGLDVAALEDADPDAIVLTPAHQFPTGAVLAPRRRTQLLEWAERNDRLIIEDDYDTELRFRGATVGALQGLAPERVLHIGSVSKRLAPGVRLGWMLLPSWLTWPVVSAKAIEDSATEVLGQMALVDFISRGELDRHLRRMRMLYARRRRNLLRLLGELVPAARWGDDPAGVLELVELPAEVDEPSLLAAAARRGVGLEGLSWHHSGTVETRGLLVGYAGLSEPALTRAVQLLAEAIGEITRG